MKLQKRIPEKEITFEYTQLKVQKFTTNIFKDRDLTTNFCLNAYTQMKSYHLSSNLLFLRQFNP